MRFLVTGGGGFIGSKLCERLLHGDGEVHAVGRTLPLTLPKEVRTWAADLSKSETADRLVNAVKPDVIFHLASTVSGKRELEMVRPTFEGNLMATVNVLIAGTVLGCRRIVLAGSMEEPRGDSYEPGSPYAMAKWASTGYAKMFHALYETPVVVLRVFMVYGPGQKDATKLVPYVSRCFIRGEAPKISSGTRPVDWVFVDDVVEAFVAASEKPGILGRSLDIGSGTQVTVRAIVERLMLLTDSKVEPVFGVVPDRPLEVGPVANIQETVDALGWTATTDLNAGLSRTIEWVRREMAGSDGNKGPD